MLADDGGDVPWRRPHGYGLFDGDTRVLDGFVLATDGRPRRGRTDLRFERRAEGRAEVTAEVRAGRLTVAPTETSPPADFTVAAAA